jgi:uncharacterized membrane protein YGL010W
MKSYAEQITTYAAYHRDVRNVATHFVGIPLIVYAVLVLMALVPIVEVAGFQVRLVHLFFVGGLVYYFLLDVVMGLTMAMVVGGLVLAAHATLALGWPWALTIGIAAFVVGWALQFLGHQYEGRKPAFVDDLNQLMIGPLFLATEVAFALGFKSDLKRAVEAKVGPSRNGAIATPAKG